MNSAPGSEHSRSWVEVNLDAIHHNAQAVRRHCGMELMAIVKANAYGHGVEQVARTLAGEVSMFGVANLLEADELRAAGVAKPVLMLGACLADEYEAALRSGYHVNVSSLEQATLLDTLAESLGVQAHAHAVIDTGMGRLGFQPEEWNARLMQQLLRLGHVRWEGLCSHLPVADEDTAFTRQQIAAFQAHVRSSLAAGFAPRWVHLTNSAGLLGFPECREFCNLSRPGLVLYGVSPLPEWQHLLRTTLTWKTRITLLRELPAGHGVSYGRTCILRQPTRVATLACGYADGYPRQVSGKAASVLIQGLRCPLLGRVTMDQIMVDVSHLPAPAAAGDEAVLVGLQNGAEILANELAGLAGTIAWDIFTGIGKRVSRVCIHD